MAGLARAFEDHPQRAAPAAAAGVGRNQRRGELDPRAVDGARRGCQVVLRFGARGFGFDTSSL